MPFPFPVGKVRADELNAALNAGRVIAYGQRASNSTASGTEQGVLRLDGVSLEAGRLYWIGTNPLSMDSTVNADVCRILLRIDTTGAAATTSSTNVALSQTRQADAGVAEELSVGLLYPAGASDVTLSVLLSHTRAGGSGNVMAVGSSVIPIQLFVVDCGEDPGDTGVDI